MLNIRYGLFETNSSSVHVLVIPKDQAVRIPKSVHLAGDEYGWAEGIEYDTLNYFYQACVDSGKSELNKFFAYLKNKGIEEIHAPELEWETGRYGTYATNNPGYIDHVEGLPLDYLFSNESLLDRFLFGEDSFVETGNDNSYNTPDEDKYDHDKYDVLEKGN